MVLLTDGNSALHTIFYGTILEWFLWTAMVTHNGCLNNIGRQRLVTAASAVGMVTHVAPRPRPTALHGRWGGRAPSRAPPDGPSSSSGPVNAWRRSTTGGLRIFPPPTSCGPATRRVMHCARRNSTWSFWQCACCPVMSDVENLDVSSKQWPVHIVPYYTTKKQSLKIMQPKKLIVQCIKIIFERLTHWCDMGWKSFPRTASVIWLGASSWRNMISFIYKIYPVDV